MVTQALPDEHHVARYCKPSDLVDGIPLPKAFELKKDEEYLSVNWLEYFGESDLNAAVERVRKAFRNNHYQVRQNAGFAVLDVGAAKSALREHTKSEPTVKHLPSRNDPSHAGIFGSTPDNFTVTAELALLVTSENVHPAVP